MKLYQLKDRQGFVIAVGTMNDITRMLDELGPTKSEGTTVVFHALVTPGAKYAP